MISKIPNYRGQQNVFIKAIKEHTIYKYELRYPKVQSRMNNPETPLTLNTRRRTKTNSKNKQHKTNNRSNTDPMKSQG
jgi:hypothetical protein